MLGSTPKKNSRPRRTANRRQNKHATTRKPRRLRVFRLHPLFLAVGVWYALTGELFVFFLSTLVALQHECAHAFAAAKLGYRLNAVVLMPYGAIIDGDLRGITCKDEMYVALCGPLCNLCTAAFFVALWWIAPTLYAFTDTACYVSLAVALVNLLPAYPLDGGRILACALTRLFGRTTARANLAEKRAHAVCRAVTLLFAAAFLLAFFGQCLAHRPNFSLLAFALFLAVGALGNREGRATYSRMDFSCRNALARGVEIRRVALLESRPVKDALRFLSRGTYLVLEIYAQDGTHLFDLPQNALSACFLAAESPYVPLGTLYRQAQNNPETDEKGINFTAADGKNVQVFR